METIINRIQYAPFRMEYALKVMLSILKGFEPNYINDNQTRLEDLICYIHATGENIEINNDCALAFIGPTGTGKTLLFKAISEYMKIDDVKFIRNGKIARFGFEIVSARYIVSKYASDGFESLQTLINKPVICIDDVGSENIGNHFGNKIEVFEHIIEERYYKHKLTHFTSNYDKEAIRQRYGERVYSRIIERTNFIEFLGKDYRVEK